MMYLAYNAPHTPLQATKADYDALPHIKDHTLRVYAAMIRSLDRNVGRVLDALKQQGLDDNTIVVFTSDNGGAHYIGQPDLNRPYRGWKATFFEGGVRVPFFMRWPGAIAAGTSFKAPVSHFDIFATALAAAGVAPPTDRKIDGVNLLPYVTGQSTGRPHDALFWRSGPYVAVQSGDWKLQVTETPRKDWLYKLADDPTEKNNLAAAHPAKVRELKVMLAAFDKEQAKPLWPSMIEIPVGVDRPLSQPPGAGDDVVYWSN
jgi:arylsulfatase A-like enzyme